MNAATMHTLTIFHTGGIRGDLALLPPLYTYLQQLKREYAAPHLLLDGGAACEPSVWHCGVTNGRSALVALDGMGYHAAYVGDYLSAAEVARLRTLVTTGMITDSSAWRYHVPPVRDEDILVSAMPTPALRLCIVITPADSARLEDGILWLQRVSAGQVGIAQVDLRATPRLIAAEIRQMPAATPPDLTIAAAIEFIEDEARYAARRQS